MEDESSLRHVIFVYGTLKRGQPYHYLLEVFGSYRFLGTGCTELNYPLIIATGANLPVLLDAPGKGKTVYGEIYHVDDECLERLDHFEGHPNLYQRDVITVRIISWAEDERDAATDSVAKEKQEVTKCNVYMRKHFDDALLDEETLSSYDAAGPHQRRFAEEQVFSHD